MELELTLPRAERFTSATVVYGAWRRLVGRVRRIVRWEFWPPYIFYAPVVAYIVYLGIRFRSWTLFTAANPDIPGGGFIGESKHDILEHLKGAAWALPVSALLAEGNADQRFSKAAAFIEKHQLQFPVVLKPDAGQRGSGVVIVRSLKGMREYFEHAPFPTILQEYVPGREFGVFYYRYPGKSRGRVLSITEKRMPIVTGDGRRTLQELIFADGRAVCMAAFYLRKNAQAAREAPAAGEPVQLVEIGTHCRGAIFLDGSCTVTPALERTIQRIADCFDGFFFGRFDIRVPSLEDFMAGKNLKVVELNGVTSEATHIYDPACGLLDAYRALFRQWRIAFEIGKANRARGVRPTSAAELLVMTRNYRQVARQHPE